METIGDYLNVIEADYHNKWKRRALNEAFYMPSELSAFANWREDIDSAAIPPRSDDLDWAWRKPKTIRVNGETVLAPMRACEASDLPMYDKHPREG